MELSLALQESQRLITAWQTPLLFVLVQLLVLLIFFKDFPSPADAAREGEEQGQGGADSDFWSLRYMPSRLSRLPSFSSASVAALPTFVEAGLRNWARRAAGHVSSTASSSTRPSSPDIY